MIKVPQFVKDGKQVYLQLCICPKADSEVIGMCLLASGFSFWPSENWSPHRTVSAALTVLSMSAICINRRRTHGQRFVYFLTL